MPIRPDPTAPSGEPPREPDAPAAKSVGGMPKGPPGDERRGGQRRRSGRAGLGRRHDDQAPGEAGAERRRSRSLSEQRRQWAEVRRWVARAELEPFRQLMERLAQAVFGPAATVVPHLRRSHGRKYLVFVVDAACPEATSNYGDFLPVEHAFWTAYATIPKPASAFMVAVRPARGWCRAEALMPIFTQFSVPEIVT